MEVPAKGRQADAIPCRYYSNRYRTVLRFDIISFFAKYIHISNRMEIFQNTIVLIRRKRGAKSVSSLVDQLSSQKQKKLRRFEM